MTQHFLSTLYEFRKPYHKRVCLLLCALIMFACKDAQDDIAVQIEPVTAEQKQTFYDNIMNARPFLPANISSREIGCNRLVSIPRNGKTHLTSKEANYDQYGWEERIAHQTNYFDIPADDGRVLIIDYANKGKDIAYRYLSNDNTYNEVYEPWSSSKIFAFTGAIATLRQQGLGAQATVGGTYIADMITSIHSYENFGTSPGDSNALASYFANIAGREYLTALFHDEWLKLSNDSVFFRGAYGPTAFQPSSHYWLMLNIEEDAMLEAPAEAADDPGYLPYRCDSCGLTGNKPMTTLAQAEWLKRLAVHERDRKTQHPHLTREDLSTLFYGTAHSYLDRRFAGMTLGVSTMLQHALSSAVSTTAEYAALAAGIQKQNAKEVLDEISQGEWRVFQKIGWGPSETRSTTENVVLAHVCLPNFQGGREFTIAAQVSMPENKEENVPLAGMKMQTLLERSLTQHLNRALSESK